MSRRPKLLLTLLFALLVVTAGCSAGSNAGAGGSGDGGEASYEQATAASGGGDGGNGGSSTSGDEAAQAEDASTASQSGSVARRELIRTGEVRLRVDDFESAEANLTAAVEAQGGYVSDTSQEVRGRDNQTWTAGTLVLRVPNENFSAFFERVKAEGEVQHAETGTEDVTDRIVDLEARLKNLRAERDRLRTLYDRANETEDVLAVGRELSETQEEIERLEAQLRTLEGRVAYSTVTVHLTEPEPEYEPPERMAWYDTSAVTAFLDSVDGVVTVVRAAFIGAAYAAPYVLVFGLPIAGAAVIIRRRRLL